MDSVLKSLTERDNICLENTIWESSTVITMKVLEKLPIFNKLYKEYCDLEATVKKMEKESSKNSEFAQRSVEIKNLKQTILGLKNDLIVKSENLKRVQESLNSIKENMDNHLSIIKGLQDKKETITSALSSLQHKHEVFFKDLNEKRISFESLASKYATMQLEHDKTVQQLMALKQKEAQLLEVQNIEVSHPTIDLSAFLVSLPKSQVETSTIIDITSTQVQRASNLETITPEFSGPKHNGSITCLAFANNNPFLASGSEDSVVNITMYDTGQRVCTLRDSSKSIMSINFSMDDKMMLTSSYDSVIRLYSVPEYRLVMANSDNRDCVNDAAFVSESRFVSCCRDQTIKVYDISKSSPISSFTTSSTPLSICPIQGESLIITAHHDGKLRGWDFRTRTMPFEIKVHKKQIVNVIGKPGSHMVYTLSSDKSIAVTDIKAKSVVGSINTIQAGMPSDKMQISVIDNIVMSGSTSGALHTYDTVQFKELKIINGHTNPLFCVSSKPSAGVMATGDKAGNIKFWKI